MNERRASTKLLPTNAESLLLVVLVVLDLVVLEVVVLLGQIWSMLVVWELIWRMACAESARHVQCGFSLGICLEVLECPTGGSCFKALQTP